MLQASKSDVLCLLPAASQRGSVERTWPADTCSSGMRWPNMTRALDGREWPGACDTFHLLWSKTQQLSPVLPREDPGGRNRKHSEHLREQGAVMSQKWEIERCFFFFS